MSDLISREYAVTAVRDQQIWAAGEHGELLRAWCPDPPSTAAGRTVSVYIGEDETVHGWYDAISLGGVDQRLISGVALEPAELICGGPCRRSWIAPAATSVLAWGCRCLECGGRLVAAPDHSRMH